MKLVPHIFTSRFVRENLLYMAIVLAAFAGLKSYFYGLEFFGMPAEMAGIILTIVSSFWFHSIGKDTGHKKGIEWCIEYHKQNGCEIEMDPTTRRLYLD